MVTLSDNLSDDDAIPLWNFLRSRGSVPDRDHVGNGTPSIKTAATIISPHRPLRIRRAYCHQVLWYCRSDAAPTLAPVRPFTAPLRSRAMRHPWDDTIRSKGLGHRHAVHLCWQSGRQSDTRPAASDAVMMV